MKKILSLMIVAVLLVSSLSVSAFAETITPDGNNGSHDVYAKYAEGSKTDTYKVVISWGDMQFTYAAENETWNTTSHEWDKNGGGWSVNKAGDDKITIINHSSKDVTATFTFKAIATDVTGAFSGEGVSNNAVVVGNALGGSEVEKTVTFAPKGTLTKTNENAADFVSVGKITISLN